MADGSAPGDAAGRALGRPDLAAELAALAPSVLQSLLIDVHRRTATTVTPAEVLRRYRRDRFAVPAATDPRALARVRDAAFRLLPPGVVPVEPSPVAPFGTAAALTGRGQAGVVATDRTLEVVADTAGVLALEAAVRRSAGPADGTVRLAATARVLRTQPFPPPYQQHFELLALCTAGRSAPGFAFEAAALVEQIGFHVALATALCRDERRVRVEIADLARPGVETRLEPLVCAPLRSRHPEADIAIDPARTRAAAYYAGAAFLVSLTGAGGAVEFCDGGLVDWTQRLLADRRERLVVSGLGIDTLARCTA